MLEVVPDAVAEGKLLHHEFAIKLAKVLLHFAAEFGELRNTGGNRGKRCWFGYRLGLGAGQTVGVRFASRVLREGVFCIRAPHSHLIKVHFALAFALALALAFAFALAAFASALDASRSALASAFAACALALALDRFTCWHRFTTFLKVGSSAQMSAQVLTHSVSTLSWFS